MSITYRCYLDGAPASGFQSRARNVFTSAETNVTIPAGGLIQPDDEPLLAIQNPNTTPDVAAIGGGIHGVPIGELYAPTVTLPPGPPIQDLSGAEIHVFFARLRLMVGITDGATTVPKSRCGVVVSGFIVLPGGAVEPGVLFPNPSYPAAPGSEPYFGRGYQWTDPTGVATMITSLGTAMRHPGASVYTPSGEGIFDATFEIRGAGNWSFPHVYRRVEEMGIDYDRAAFDAATGLWPIPVQGSAYVADPRPDSSPPGYAYPTVPKGYKQSIDVRIRDTAGAPIVGADVTLSPGGYHGVTASVVLPGEIAPTGRVVIPVIPLGSTLAADLGDRQPGASWFDFPLESAGGYPSSAPPGVSITPPRVVDPDFGATDYPLYYLSIVTDTLTSTSGPPTRPPPVSPAFGWTGGEWASLPYRMTIALAGTVLIADVPVYAYEEQVTTYIKEGFVPAPPGVGPLALDIDRLGNAWAARVQDHQVVVARRLSAWRTPAQAPWQVYPVGSVGASPWVHVDEASGEMRVNVVFGWGADTVYHAASTANALGGWSLTDIATGVRPFIRKDKATGITYYLYWRGDTVYLKRSADDGQTFLPGPDGAEGEPEIEVLASAIEATYTLDFRLDPAHTVELPYSDGTDIKSRISVDNGLTWSDSP